MLTCHLNLPANIPSSVSHSKGSVAHGMGVTVPGVVVDWYKCTGGEVGTKKSFLIV